MLLQAGEREHALGERDDAGLVLRRLELAATEVGHHADTVLLEVGLLEVHAHAVGEDHLRDLQILHLAALHDLAGLAEAGVGEDGLLFLLRCGDLDFRAVLVGGEDGVRRVIKLEVAADEDLHVGRVPRLLQRGVAVLRGDRRQFGGHAPEVVDRISEDLFAPKLPHERIGKFVVLARLLLLGAEADVLEHAGRGFGEFSFREAVEQCTAQFLFGEGERGLPLLRLALGIDAVVLDEAEHLEVVALGLHDG